MLKSTRLRIAVATGVALMAVAGFWLWRSSWAAPYVVTIRPQGRRGGTLETLPAGADLDHLQFVITVVPTDRARADDPPVTLILSCSDEMPPLEHAWPAPGRDRTGLLFACSGTTPGEYSARATVVLASGRTATDAVRVRLRGGTPKVERIRVVEWLRNQIGLR
jgi:hypothetical protein